MPFLATEKLLLALEVELKALGMWSTTAPDEAALTSQVPFACDSMAFEAWLQFILLPKMRLLIEAQMPLPSSIATAPMAEHVWGEAPTYRNLITLLRALDELLTKQAR
ncbi:MULTISPECIES: YqcC family protein [Shewanella]|jgi:uncharacterized protein YqcC (DUF446 family)|uniref:YqcC family protein n=2 Tax=Shewanellaceae TaxID=267890 RepID=A0A6G7LUB2_9GAMM|nr:MULTISPECIES: YqcC family protein [Shewanella]MBZ4680418.1 hypothetical protein [Shewanella sp.]MCA0949293.1 YqcC family protein [Shewanella chilikensis]MCL1152797.1 YqcC family protein [Shewanella chilikensis]MCL1162633.1 YqcC family protein [Shewanella chilikensis]PYE60419.1 dTDP-4-dehydrorhamnose 3,5-epimerase [Shewanella chilikensis]